MKEYSITTDTKYISIKKYYSYDETEEIYTLLVAGTDYTIGDNVASDTYDVKRMEVSVCGAKFYMSEYAYDKNKITVDGTDLPLPSTLPVELNDVDLDAYTNTDGYTQRNRVREDIEGLEFEYNALNGTEIKSLLNLTNKVWMNVSWYSEKADAIVTHKFYRSKINYIRYYLDENPADSIYTGITYSFVQQ